MRVVIALTTLLTFAGAARAAVIEVTPGPGTPIQDAINAANPGDTILLQAGVYPESITIDRKLRIRGSKDGTIPEIATDCTAGTAVDVTADHVKIQHVHIRSGSVYGIDIDGRDDVTVKDTSVREGCAGVLYGINVYQSTRVKISLSYAAGFTDAGIYIGGIPVGGRVRAVRNVCEHNPRGILVEDSPAGSKVNLRRNRTDWNTDGIFLSNVQEAKVSGTTLLNNLGNGIWADAASIRNRIFGNRIASSGSFDILDDSNNNCWRRNTFTTGVPNTNGC